MLNRDVKQKPLLLVDADITAFKAASGKNKETGAYYTAEEACIAVDKHMKFLMEYLNGDDIVCCMTGPENFRRTVYPMYKANRLGKPAPVVLTAVRKHIRDHFFTLEFAGLEADDIIGILATESNRPTIICSSDKDFCQIPGVRFNSDKWKEGLLHTTLREADLFFYRQVIAGDPTDGYAGVPGVGGMGAEVHIAAHLEKTGGSLDGMWPHIVKLYEQYGLTEAYALAQARCARILRHGEYDFATKEVKLWTPSA